MPTKLPPLPQGVAPGSYFWNDWYEKLRTLVNSILAGVDWSLIINTPTTLAGYGITDAQKGLQFQDEGANLGASGTADTVDFVGTGVTATRASNTITVTIPTASVSDGDKGDITVSGGGATWTIDNDVVSFAKMLNATAASVLVGRGAGAGAGDFQEITLGANLSMAGTVLSASGGAGASWTETEIDFGAAPVYSAQFTITDAAITSSAVKMQVLPCGKAATGRTADDWLWDGAMFAANPGTGSAVVYANFNPGPIVGLRRVQYSVG